MTPNSLNLYGRQTDLGREFLFCRHCIGLSYTAASGLLSRSQHGQNRENDERETPLIVFLSTMPQHAQLRVKGKIHSDHLSLHWMYCVTLHRNTKAEGVLQWKTNRGKKVNTGK